jgi:hypothetical protein
MLYNDHLKAGKELQRKIDKLREENKDPSLPQKPAPSLPVSNSNAANTIPQPVPSPPPSGRRMTDSQNTGEESFMVLGQRVRHLLILAFKIQYFLYVVRSWRRIQPVLADLRGHARQSISTCCFCYCPSGC